MAGAAAACALRAEPGALRRSGGARRRRAVRSIAAFAVCVPSWPLVAPLLELVAHFPSCKPVAVVVAVAHVFEQRPFVGSIPGDPSPPPVDNFHHSISCSHSHSSLPMRHPCPILKMRASTASPRTASYMRRSASSAWSPGPRSPSSSHEIYEPTPRSRRPLPVRTLGANGLCIHEVARGGAPEPGGRRRGGWR